MSIAQTANGHHHSKRRKLDHVGREADIKRPGRDIAASDNDSQDESASVSAREVAKRPKTKHRSQNGPNGSTSKSQSSSIATKSSAPSSVTFNLHVTELLRDNKPNYTSRLRKVKPFVERIENAINSIPEQKSLSLLQAETFAKKILHVTVPWRYKPAPDINYKFAFARPSKVFSTGSLIHQFGTRGSANVQLVPIMPEELFQEKDYLNFRAIHKRAFYLACIASALQRDLQNDFELRYEYFEDNDLIPVLSITPRSDGKPNQAISFTIHPSFPSTLGPIEKMLPGLKCLRKEDVVQSDSQYHTDHEWVYNGTVRVLSAASDIHMLVEKVANTAENFRDSCLLGAVWLQQRGFTSHRNAGGFGLHEWALMCSLLLESGGPQGRPLFSSRYSAIQLFKAMLQVLSTRDMLDPFIVRGSYPLDKSDRPVMFDAMTGLNIFYKMTLSSYTQLRLAATISLAAVNSQKIDGFDTAFISKISDPVLQYDEVYRIDLAYPDSSHVRARLLEILERGLGDRVSLVELKSLPREPWKLSTSSPLEGTKYAVIGLLVNPEAASRLLDHGPSIEEKEAMKEFRSFWGEKAELRKFKDGRISESLTWSTDSSVTRQIVLYLCSRHLDLQPSAITVSTPLETTQLHSMLSSSDRSVFSTVDSTFQSLSSTLHRLDGLPLPIRSVTPASPSLRSSSILLPLQSGHSQPMDIIVQFDTSGRWPDHLAAVQFTKIAFLTKISDLLTATDKTLTTRIGIENTTTSSIGTQNTSYLDISFRSPAATIPPTTFRLRIYHDREIHLIQQELNSRNSSLQGPLRDAYQSALIAQKRVYIAAPQHTMAIRNLITQFPPLSTTVRLLKRWVSAHHLANHIPESILEIICAYVFLSPLPWTTPGTATTAFGRCLNFLAKWDWTREPLIVDLSPSQDMTAEERTELFTRFAAWRKLDPNLNTVAWFVGTNIDSTGVVWTQSDLSHKGPQPARVIAGRVSALAGAAVQVLKYTDETEKQQREIMSKEDWDSIFTSSLADFDFVIHLKDDSFKNSSSNGKKKQYKNLELASSLEVDSSGIDDIESFVEDLEDTFGSAALFFYGGRESGNRVIGGLWRPHLRGEKVWKIRLGYSTVPVPTSSNNEEGEAQCIANLDAMLAEMAMMGEGIVERISQKE